jgi:hypothetical protein
MDIQPVLGWSVPKGFLKKLEKALSDYNDINEKNKAAAERALEKQSEGDDQGPDPAAK